MVKRKRLADKPDPPHQPSPDAWVSSGGRDPEAIAATETPTASTDDVPETPPEQPPEPKEDDGKGKGKAYPHRISFDMDKAQYKRLKWASFDSDRPMNEILREAVEDWMRARDY